MLVERTDLSSIKEELVPWLCRTQYRIAAKRKYGTILKPIGNTQALAVEHSTVQPAAKPTRHYAKKKLDAGDAGADSPGGLQSPKSPPTAMSIASSLPTSPRISGLQKLLEHEESKANIDIRCAFVVHKLENGTAIRANTVKTYFDANRLVRRMLCRSHTLLPLVQLIPFPFSFFLLLVSPRRFVSTTSRAIPTSANDA